MLARPRIAAAAAWPQADALFRSDERWRGSDDAYSIELSPGRTLWLFGDTFVEGADRASAAFIRNSVGIQNGSDPASAAMTFHWRTGPDSFFAAPPGTWYWPLQGAIVGDELLLFMMAVRSPAGGTGAIEEWRDLGPLGFFDVFGWAALVVENPADEPTTWRIRRVAAHAATPVLGASVLVHGDRLLVYGWDDDKHLFLARWPVTASPDPAGAEWWTGNAWRRDADLRQVVIEEGSTEFTVHQDAHGYRQTQMFTETGSLAVRSAERPEGPWSSPEVVFTPEETLRPGVFVYAGKAHPHLSGADLVLTYASNADVDVCLDDESIYYPRFVRVTEAR